jgi:TatD DNase family protein
MDIPRLPLIDSHCHLTDRRFAEDLPETIERARTAGHRALVLIGDSHEGARECLDISGRFKQLPIFVTAGVHPHNAEQWSPETGRRLREFCEENPGRVVAVGEIGLDFHYNFAPRERQFEAFLDQARLARELGLPVVMHCREAHGEFVEILRRDELKGLRGVVHCFSGDVSEAKELVAMGFFLGIDGPLTFKKNETLCEVVRAVPIDHLLLETDAPYLAPVPMRGKRNEPAFLAWTALRLARELETPADIVAHVVSRNTIRLFDLKDIQ